MMQGAIVDAASFMVVLIIIMIVVVFVVFVVLCLLCLLCGVLVLNFVKNVPEQKFGVFCVKVGVEPAKPNT